VVSSDPAHARSIGRLVVRDPCLSLRNYTNNLLREGFTPGDIADGGSDKLIDSLVLHGPPGQILDGLRMHHAAGADHVGIQVIGEPGETPMAGFRSVIILAFRPSLHASSYSGQRQPSQDGYKAGKRSSPDPGDPPHRTTHDGPGRRMHQSPAEPRVRAPLTARALAW
jgi:hypothetical protein